MNGVDIAKTAIGMSTDWIMGMIEDMRDAPLTRATAGGNHTLWCLGHLAYSEGSLINELVKGESNPIAEWACSVRDRSRPTTPRTILRLKKSLAR
jgi:hypothetical protein